jgi:hypothetical protein
MKFILMENKMIGKNKIIFYSTVIFLTLLTSACSGSVSNSTASAENQAAVQQGTPGAIMPEGTPGAMPPQGPPGARPPAGEAPAAGQANDQTAEQTATEEISATPTAAPTATPDEESTEKTMPLNINAVLSIANKTFIKTHEDINSDEDDTGAALITGGGNLTVGYAAVTTSGDTTSVNNSAGHGQNAALLGEGGSVLKVLYGSVATSGKGAAGVFGTEEDTVVTVLDETINTNGDYARGVIATKLATMNVTNTDISTSGYKSAAIATGNEGGTITVEGGSAATSGSNAPAVYATGSISLSGMTLSAENSPAIGIEGAGTVSANAVEAASNKTNGGAVEFYPSSSVKVESGAGSLSMTGGSLTANGSDSALFYAVNAEGTINLNAVALNAASGILMRTQALSGDQYSTGGSLTLTTDDQTLNGDIYADSASVAILKLTNGSTFTGSIGSDNKGRVVGISLDASSTWNVTADSYLTKMDDEAGITDLDVTNIIGNGHTVYYNKNANVYLRGRIYNLSGGGYLKPLN